MFIAMLFVMPGPWRQTVIHHWEGGKVKNMVGAEHIMERQNKDLRMQLSFSEYFWKRRGIEGKERKLQLGVLTWA